MTEQTPEPSVQDLNKTINSLSELVDDLHSRLSHLESRVSRFDTPLAGTPSTPNNPPPSLFDAEQIVRQHLPVDGEEKEKRTSGGTSTGSADPTPLTPTDIPPRGEQQLAHAVIREAAGRAAQTNLPRPLSRNFRPSEFGYTTDDFTRDYPDVNPHEVLESFFNHHMAKGSVSRNWLEKFWQYAHIAQQMEKENKMSNPTPTDSMGLPLDRQARRRMLGQD